MKISGRIPYFTKHDLELIHKMAKHQALQTRSAMARPGGQMLEVQEAMRQQLADLEAIIEKIETA